MAHDQQKRSLKLESLDELVAEANRLLGSGYTSRGKWNLAQTCFHLAEWTRFPMDGFPRPPLLLRMIFGVMKATGMVAKMKAGILRNGFRPGTPTAPQTTVQAGALTDQAGVEQLTRVIDRMKHFTGVIQPSPLFGEMDRELWTRVTLLHAEHHLGFLEPS